jgi:hypothetical protein
VHKVIELARNPLAADQFLIVQLLQSLDTRKDDYIVIIWPDSPTELPPSQLTPVSNAIVIALAVARTQFAAIRAADQ